MPGPALIPLIAAGTELVSQGANAISSGAQNRKSRAFAREMYNRQRADALADWQMQADYNSPTQQMKRLVAAGLNPNLVYGHGADAQMSAAPRSANYGQAQFRPTEFSGAAAIQAYQNTRMQNLQSDNVQALNDKIRVDTLKSLAEVDTKNFDLDMKRALKELVIQTAEANLAGKKEATNYILNKNQREALASSQNLQIGFARLALLQAQTNTEGNRTNLVGSQDATEQARLQEIYARMEALGITNRLKELEIQLKQMDVDWSKALSNPLLNNVIGGLLRAFIAGRKK